MAAKKSGKSYEEQLNALDQEMDSIKEQKKEILQKWSNEQKEADKSILPELGSVIQMFLNRHLTEADVQNLYAFLYGQEHRGTSHFFTDFMNDEEYRNQALKGAEFKNMPEYKPVSRRKRSRKGSNTPKAQKADTDDSEA